MDYTPIKIKVKYGIVNDKGKLVKRHIFPDFNSLPDAVLTVTAHDGSQHKCDWSNYIDLYGNGLINDCCGFGYERKGPLASGLDEWFAGCIVPPAFAAAAVAAFPNEVEILDEATWEQWHDNAFMARSRDEHIDTDILQGIKLKQDLGIQLSQEDLDGLDPTKMNARGLRKNDSRRWADVKRRKKANIVAPPRP